MYARTITIDARPDSLDAGIAHVRDTVLPEVTNTPGCVGMSFVVDRTTGHCIATTSWESEQALRESEERVRATRQEASEILGGSPSVEIWELVVMHRNHPAPEGAWVRASWLQVDPAGLDDSIEVFKTVALPTLEGFDGFCSASLLVDRATGRSLSTVAYDSEDAMTRARGKADELRSRSASRMRGDIQEVREFELVLAHLHAPEMA